MKSIKESAEEYVDEKLTHPDFDRQEADEIAHAAYLAGARAMGEKAARFLCTRCVEELPIEIIEGQPLHRNPDNGGLLVCFAMDLRNLIPE